MIDVRPRGERLQVTYFDASQNLRSVSARFVIMAGSKHIAKYVLFDLEHWDCEKLQAIDQIANLRLSGRQCPSAIADRARLLRLLPPWRWPALPDEW